jgi:Zn-dependent protease
LELSITPSAWWSMAGAWLGFSVLAYWLLGFDVGQALLAGLLAALIHWLSEFAHQYGHALAALRAGYPMTGLRFWGVFGTSLWPADEPALPGRTHIRRALGGPAVSLLAGLLAALVAWGVGQTAGMIFWLALWAAIDNLLVLGVGAFLPLGFTDGSTILYWWNK